MGFFQETQERVRNSRGTRAISVPAIEVLLYIIVGQEPTALAVGAGGVAWTFFFLSVVSLFFLPLSGRRPDID